MKNVHKSWGLLEASLKAVKGGFMGKEEEAKDSNEKATSTESVISITFAFL